MEGEKLRCEKNDVVILHNHYHQCLLQGGQSYGKPPLFSTFPQTLLSDFTDLFFIRQYPVAK
jgi:hypothetical protein